MASGRRIRVYVADDHPMFLDALVGAIGERADLELVGSAADGADAVAGIRDLSPEVAVLDMRLRRLTGEEVLRWATEHAAPTRILFLSAHIESDLVYRALAAGGAGHPSQDLDRDAVCGATIPPAPRRIAPSPGVPRLLGGAVRERGR